MWPDPELKGKRGEKGGEEEGDRQGWPGEGCTGHSKELRVDEPGGPDL